jgi:cell division septation protein DedD
MRRYRPSRPWPVGGLALVAAAGAVLTTGLLSSALDAVPHPAFAGRIEQLAAAGRPTRDAKAALPAATAPAAASSAPRRAGLWQIQVGAFRSRQAAEAHLRALGSDMPELARLTAAHQLHGRIDRVRLGGIEDEAAARQLCSRILATGRGCFVVRPES